MVASQRTPARRSGVQVVEKAAHLLDALAGVEVSVAELAQRLGEPRSSVYRLLSTLQRLEYVEPGIRPGTYRLGLKLFRLGAVVLSRFDERQAALPAMESLHELTEETVFLCVRRGTEAVCIERIEGRWVRSMGLVLGGSLPLHIGAAPRVLLAFESDEFVDDYLRGPLAQLTSATPADPDRIRALLATIRNAGVSISDGDVREGIAAIGAPVFAHDGRVAAAVSLSGPHPIVLAENRERIASLVLETARSISQALGYIAPAGRRS